jgi:hypothetical protein
MIRYFWFMVHKRNYCHEGHATFAFSPDNQESGCKDGAKQHARWRPPVSPPRELLKISRPHKAHVT